MQFSAYPSLWRSAQRVGTAQCTNSMHCVLCSSIPLRLLWHCTQRLCIMWYFVLLSHYSPVHEQYALCTFKHKHPSGHSISLLSTLPLSSIRFTLLLLSFLAGRFLALIISLLPHYFSLFFNPSLLPHQLSFLSRMVGCKPPSPVYGVAPTFPAAVAMRG